MSEISTALPADLATAHELIANLNRENAWLRHRLDVLSRRLFGKRTEQLSADQLALAFEQLENEPGKQSEPIETDSGEGPLADKRDRKSVV